MLRKRALLTIPVVSIVSVASVLGGTYAAAAPTSSVDSSRAQLAVRPSAVPARGALSARIDPDSMNATPIHGGRVCRLTDHTTLTLSGTVSGTVEGSTTAYVNASCDQATSTIPGTYPTTFTLRGTFRGKVADRPARGKVIYSGTVRTEGDISAVLHLNGRASAVLRVRAMVGATGTYEGIAVAPGKR